MSNWKRFIIGLGAAVVIVLSGEQSSIDGMYVFSSHRLNEQREVYEVSSYLKEVRAIAERAKELNNDDSSGYYQSG